MEVKLCTPTLECLKEEFAKFLVKIFCISLAYLPKISTLFKLHFVINCKNKKILYRNKRRCFSHLINFFEFKKQLCKSVKKYMQKYAINFRILMETPNCPQSFLICNFYYTSSMKFPKKREY